MHYIRGMERSISATDANREFSRVLNEVAGGETYIVTSRGKPVARLAPMRPEEMDQAERQRRLHALLDRLAELPPQNLGRVTRDDGYE
ncbi:type II toxin-antitoxin system Phd/YefM family antitoxin [Brevundimonas sp.]|jgi:prevent-host-death family protein|uniref:type II toxin-antitoxin system Phd/YefM family antitoxin n=1 Tax=Brevundimonas sp. TaxID=1871086 RepID=UPI0037839099